MKRQFNWMLNVKKKIKKIDRHMLRMEKVLNAIKKKYYEMTEHTTDWRAEKKHSQMQRRKNWLNKLSEPIRRRRIEEALRELEEEKTAALEVAAAAEERRAGRKKRQRDDEEDNGYWYIWAEGENFSMKMDGEIFYDGRRGREVGILLYRSERNWSMQIRENQLNGGVE